MTSICAFRLDAELQSVRKIAHAMRIIMDFARNYCLVSSPGLHVNEAAGSNGECDRYVFKVESLSISVSLSWLTVRA